MKKRWLLVPAFTAPIFVLYAASSDPSYSGSVFSDVWGKLQTGIYDEADLPSASISFWSTLGWFKDTAKAAALRTLGDRNDYRDEPFHKLAHPNGVCLKGTWQITESNPYGGYFKQGSEAKIIARASTAMSETRHRKESGGTKLRGFGLAGKLFPVDSFTDSRRVQTANFFLVDDLGGTDIAHYTEAQMTNQPSTTRTLDLLLNIAYALRLSSSFGKADEITSGHNETGIRQLYEISELGEAEPGSVLTPKWMRISAAAAPKIDENDFRNELRVENYNGSLSFDIEVTSAANESGLANPETFRQIGVITFVESVTSTPCDKNLHFHHPQWRTDLNHPAS